MRWLNGITNSMDMNLGQTPGDGEGPGGLACCSPWSHKELDTTQQLNNSGSQSGYIRINWSAFKIKTPGPTFNDSESVNLKTENGLFLFINKKKKENFPGGYTDVYTGLTERQVDVEICDENAIINCRI